MMQTIAQYAQSRGVSESTVKNRIRELGIEPLINPHDKRQRLLTNDHQRQIDATLPKRPDEPGDAHADPAPVEVVQYQRPEEVSLVLAEDTLTIGAVDFGYQSIDQDPLYQAMLGEVQQLQVRTAATDSQLTQFNQAHADSDRAMRALKRLRTVSKARQEAQEDFFVSQQAYEQEIKRLELEALRGASQPPQAPVTPPPQSIHSEGTQRPQNSESVNNPEPF